MQTHLDDYNEFKQSNKYKIIFNNRLNASKPYNLEFNIDDNNGGMIITAYKYFYVFDIFKFKIFSKQVSKINMFVKVDLIIFVLIDLYINFKITNLLKALLQGCVNSPYQLKLFYNNTFCDIHNIYIYNFELLKLSTNIKYDEIYSHSTQLNKPFNELQLKKINKHNVELSYRSLFGIHSFELMKKDIVVVSWILFKYYSSTKLLIMLLQNGICDEHSSHFYLKLMKY